jgi:hypothetical protein
MNHPTDEAGAASTGSPILGPAVPSRGGNADRRVIDEDAGPFLARDARASRDVAERRTAGSPSEPRASEDADLPWLSPGGSRADDESTTSAIEDHAGAEGRADADAIMESGVIGADDVEPAEAPPSGAVGSTVSDTGEEGDVEPWVAADRSVDESEGDATGPASSEAWYLARPDDEPAGGSSGTWKAGRGESESALPEAGDPWAADSEDGSPGHLDVVEDGEEPAGPSAMTSERHGETTPEENTDFVDEELYRESWVEDDAFADPDAGREAQFTESAGEGGDEVRDELVPMASVGDEAPAAAFGSVGEAAGTDGGDPDREDGDETGEHAFPLTSAEIPGASAAVLGEIAERLERIAQSLRSRNDDDLGGDASDPLEVLITGYALGYSEGVRSAGGAPRDDE